MKLTLVSSNRFVCAIKTYYALITSYHWCAMCDSTFNTRADNGYFRAEAVPHLPSGAVLTPLDKGRVSFVASVERTYKAT